MLSPIPLSLCCTLLLCFPLALFFSTSTIIPPIDTISSISNTNITINPNTNITNPSTSSPTTTPSPLTQNKTKITNFTSPSPTEAKQEEEEDKSLFRLASHTSPNPTPPPKKLAFLFLTTTPLPLAPLWELFFQNQSKNLFNIYIHRDPSRPYNPPFSPLFSNRTIASKPTHRAHPSLISATRRLLSHALLDDPSNAMFAVLSPSCIPLRSFPFIYTTLTNSPTKSFIEILSREPTLRSRYEARGPDTMLPEIPFRSFRVGSQFFVLTRAHARRVVSDTRLWAKFKLPCTSVDTCYPEEHYFPTLLSMEEEDPRTCVPATLTHVDWRGSHNGHPRMYGPSQVGPDLIRELRIAKPRFGDARAGNGRGAEVYPYSYSYPFLFARKFSPKCLEPLMRIARDVIFRD